MLLRVRALAAVSEQTLRAFALDERLKKEGGGEEEEEREKQTVAPCPGSHRASTRRWQRRRRPEDCHLKPGVRFEASQICAGKSAAAAQKRKNVPVDETIIEGEGGGGVDGETLWFDLCK